MATGRQNIINVQGSYHGSTLMTETVEVTLIFTPGTFGTMALTTSKTVYSAGFHPVMVRWREIAFFQIADSCHSLEHTPFLFLTGISSAFRKTRPRKKWRINVCIKWNSC